MQCTHIKPDGTQCKGYAMENQAYCWFHNPQVEKIRRATNSLGGKAYSSGVYEPLPPVKFQDYRDTTGFLIDTLNQMRSGKIGTRTAVAMAHIYSVLRPWLQTEQCYRESQEFLRENIRRRWEERQNQIHAQQEEDRQQEDEQDQYEYQDED